MNKQDFFELTGENPEDVLGPDFNNLIEYQMQAHDEYWRET